MTDSNVRVTVIGSGRMGEALVRGFIRSGMAPDKITVFDSDEDKMTEVAGKHTVNEAESASAAAAMADIIILAVKPDIVPLLAGEISKNMDADKIVVSIAAGVPTAVIEAGLPAGTRVVRVMPNSPAEKGAGMAAVSGGSSAGKDDVEAVRDLFCRVGLATIVDESLQNVATAISGSGPAYFYYVIKALTDAGVEEGLDRETAYMLAHETMFGASRMLKYSKRTPGQLIDAVRSPGGTTAAALDTFEKENVDAIIKKAVKAASERAKEIEGRLQEAGA